MTVSAIPEASHANSLSVLTFEKSRTAMAGGAASAAGPEAACDGTGCGTGKGSTGAMNR